MKTFSVVTDEQRKEMARQWDRQRDRSKPWRKWYHTKLWKGLRQAVLPPLNMVCAECAKEGKSDPPTEADHIIPHRGDFELFCDPNNLQGLCETHHNQKTGKGQ